MHTTVFQCIAVGEYIGELIVSLDGAELRRVVGLVSSLVSAMRWVGSVGHVMWVCLLCSLEYDQLEMCSARKERLQSKITDAA